MRINTNQMTQFNKPLIELYTDNLGRGRGKMVNRDIQIKIDREAQKAKDPNIVTYVASIQINPILQILNILGNIALTAAWSLHLVFFKLNGSDRQHVRELDVKIDIRQMVQVFTWELGRYLKIRFKCLDGINAHQSMYVRENLFLLFYNLLYIIQSQD